MFIDRRVAAGFFAAVLGAAGAAGAAMLVQPNAAAQTGRLTQPA